MSKYIDAMAAADKIRELVVHFGKHSQMGSEFLSGAEAAAEALRYMPPADVAPAVHGQWKGFIRPQFMGTDGWGYPKYRDGRLYYCSECNRKSIIRTSYCPNCGARMDEHDKSNNDN